MSKKEKIVYSNVISIVLMIVFMYTIIPFGAAMARSKFVFDRVANEGYVAYIVNEGDLKEDNNDEEDDEVQCDGSGFITHGDGHKTPCPGCSKCQKSEIAAEPVPSKDYPIDSLTGRAIVDYVDKSKEEIRSMVEEVSDMRDEVSILRDEVKENAQYVEDLIVSEPIENWDTPREGINPEDMIQGISLKPEELKNMAVESKQVAMFGANWCGPCRQFKNAEVEKLRRAGWRVGTGPQSQIRIIDIDEDRATYQKWAKKAGVNTIPLFILIKRGEFVGYKSGFKSGTEIAEWYNAN
jgi:thiol-disulfide isomerase/thioredoxin